VTQPLDYRAYVRGQIQSLTEALTRVMFGDFSAVARTQEPDEAFGYLCAMINVAINAARNAQDELRRSNEQLAETNERLKRSEAYLAEAQRLSHMGSWADDPARRKALYWSDEMFRIHGLDPQQGPPTSETFLEHIHPEDRESVHEVMCNAVQEKTEYDVEHRVILPNGTIKHVHALGHPVLNRSGDVVEVVGSAVDVTERKRAEKEHERLRQLEAELARMNRVSMMAELAASIVHELNQPLSGVVVNGNACLRWLAGDAPNLEEARENARRIVRDGKRAGDIIGRIRALATKTATAMARVDMNETIREVIVLAQTEVRRNNVTLRTELANDLSPVLGDRVQLQQVVLNLVMNAVEAMSTVGERPRELVVRTQNDEDDLARITVQDSGIGLDPQSVERIFDAFYTTKSGGMGMGLSICRSIVQHHGGRLWAVANDGPGTTLQFTVQKYDIAARNSVAGA
jgi:PAS domain S-box-containing protein